jgi:hypothetical protein
MMEASFFEHLKENHPLVDNEDHQQLAEIGSMPQPRTSDLCPICSTRHQQRNIPQFLSTPAIDASGSTEMPASIRKQRVGFLDQEAPGSEENKHSADGSSPRRPTRRSTRAIDDHGVENCIAEHLKGLAFSFSMRLYDEDERASNLPSGGSIDSDLSELELPEVGPDDDPPCLPSGQCDEIDDFDIPDVEKEEMKKCIAENLKLLSEVWDYNANRQADESRLSHDKKEEWLPDIPRQSNEVVWNGTQPKFALAYAACVSILMELCRKALLNTRDEWNENIQGCLSYLIVYSTVLRGLHSLSPSSDGPKSAYFSVRNLVLVYIRGDERIISCFHVVVVPQLISFANIIGVDRSLNSVQLM